MERVDIKQLSPEDRELVARADGVRRNGYAPYSNFLVGAAARTSDGQVFVGANVENASYGLSICAEVAALTAANTAGAHGIVAIAVVGRSRQAAKKAAGRLFTTPCGRCRQLIFEASQLAGTDTTVIAVAQDGESALVTTIGELLPEAFGPADLGIVARTPEKAVSSH
jgi:cytidine deaminase